MATIKKLYFVSGVDVTAPTDLTSESSTVHVQEYVDDAAFVTANGSATGGDIYINTTFKCLRLYTGSSWRSVAMQTDASDPTKTWLVDLTGATTGTSATLDFNQTASRIYSFPDYAGTVALNTGTDTNPVLFPNATGNTDIGHASGTVRLVGNLEVQGTTTTINTATLEVEDTNVVINNGGTDITAEGAGLTVDRSGISGSLIYADAATSKWKGGALGSEVEFADISSSQTLTNKTISGASNTISNISLTSQVTGTLPIGSGGTGQTTANAALNALLPSQSGNANKYLKTDGTNTSWASTAGGTAPTLGDTSGSAIPAGYIGEVISSGAMTTTPVASTTLVDMTGASITLTTGIWMIHATILVEIETAGNGAGFMAIYDNSNNYIGGNGSFRARDPYYSAQYMNCVVICNSSTTYKIRVAGTGSTIYFRATGDDQSFTNDSRSQFYAVRIG